MRLSDVSRFATGFDGVKESRGDGMSTWRYRGRLMVRQLDDTHVVLRSSFDAHHLLLRSFRETFSVPTRFAKHMMVDLQGG